MLDFLHSPEFQTALGTIILGLAGLIAFSVTGYVLRLLDGHITRDKFEYLQSVAAIAVAAAEQVGMAGTLRSKRDAAIRLVQIYLDSAKVTGFTLAQIEAAVEAAVLDQFNRWKVGLPTETTVEPEGEVIT